MYHGPLEYITTIGMSKVFHPQKNQFLPLWQWGISPPSGRHAVEDFSQRRPQRSLTTFPRDPDRGRDLPKVTQPVSGRAKSRTQVSKQKLFSCTYPETFGRLQVGLGGSWFERPRSPDLGDACVCHRVGYGDGPAEAPGESSPMRLVGQKKPHTRRVPAAACGAQ